MSGARESGDNPTGAPSGTADNVSRKVTFVREIPGDSAFVAPLVASGVRHLVERALVSEDEREKVALCLTEALKNAVVHGSEERFDRPVRLSVWADESQWGFLVEDEGAGFDPARVPDPAEDGNLWGEAGRGLHLMRHFMDRVEHYASGTALLLARNR